MSGFGAPCFTTVPVCDLARSILLSGRTAPFVPSSSRAAPSVITTSAASPRPNRVGIASGESPIEGPRVVTRWCPVSFSKAGLSSEYTWKKPEEIITCTSAADAGNATVNTSPAIHFLMAPSSLGLSKGHSVRRQPDRRRRPHTGASAPDCEHQHPAGDEPDPRPVLG